MIKKLFRLRKHNPKQPQEWMKWFAAALVIYAVLVNSGGGKKPEEDVSEDPKTLGHELVADAKDAIGVDELSFFPKVVKKLTVKDIKIGQGGLALCGQQVVVRAKKMPDGDVQERSFTLGFGGGPELSQQGFLQQAVVGMKAGGVREVFTADSEHFELTMKEVAPKLPEFAGYRVFGDVSEAGSIYKCGDAAKLNVQISDIAGKKLFDSKESGKPVEFIIGKSEVFMGLEIAALGMNVEGVRSAIVPTAFQGTLNGNKPQENFLLTKKQAVIVDIESVR